MPRYLYDSARTDRRVLAALELISEDFPVSPARSGARANVAFALTGQGPAIQRQGRLTRVTGATIPQLLRALATLRGFASAGATPSHHAERPRFDTLGLMLDCSRNGVANVQTVKLLLRRLALMGMNLFMLYTEDTYEVPGEPHIGYLRGRFSQAELRSLDDYAHTLGIEMIPCIQTLAHLAQMLRWWKRYGDVKGSGDFLYVGQPKTYALLEKMIAAASKPFRSRRIHVGMDEAHGIGHGRYPAIPGPGGRSEFDIMIEHLRAVVGITNKLGLKPMMWSDMFFTIAANERAAPRKHGTPPPDERKLLTRVGKQIPREMELVFWNYYECEPEFYQEKIDAHRAMDKDPIFAPGLWSDYVFWSHFSHARLDTDPGMLACKSRGVRQAFTTAWGDGGMSVDILSALTGLQHFAEHGYRDTVSTEDLRRQFRGTTGLDFDAMNAGERIDDTPNLAPTLREWATQVGRVMPDYVKDILDERGHQFFGHNPSIYLLWQDPLVGIYDGHLEKLDLAGEYAKVSAILAKARKAGRQERHRLAFVHALSRVLELKADLGMVLRRAYVRGDRRALARAANQTIPAILARLRVAHEAHRRTWFELYKPNGWEVIDVRWSGLAGRLRSTQLRLRDYLAGRVEIIPELAEKRLEIGDFPKGRLGYGGPHYRSVISPSLIT